MRDPETGGTASAAGPVEPMVETRKPALPGFHRYGDAADLAACRMMIRTGSRSFYAASLLLPKSVRDPAYVVYAFCRMADDRIDLHHDHAQALRELRHRLAGIYAGMPADYAADRSLADVVRQYDVPRALLDGLLEGFEWDAAGRRYETLEELFAYAARVAGAVGAVMTVVMGAREAGTLARACDLGVAMQLTNIARDVGEDARAGRVYLPLSWLRAEGVDPDAWLAAPDYTPAVGRVVQRLLDAAEPLYERAAGGVADLPLGCRAAINAARRLYAEIGREVERQGLDSVSRRSVVSAKRKLSLAVNAAAEAVALAPQAHAPPLAETRFLVEAAARPGRAGAPEDARALAQMESRVAWVLDLFLELERRERLGGARGADA